MDKIVNERQIKNGERTKNMTGNSSKPVENINDSHSQLKMAQKLKILNIEGNMSCYF